MLLSFKSLREVTVQGARENQICLPEQWAEDENKKEEAASTETEPAPLSSRELLKKQEEILKQSRLEAQKKAEDMLQKAQKEAELIKKEAFKKGYEDGLQQSRQEAETIKTAARKMLAEARAEAKGIVAAAEPEIIQMAVSLAEKLLQQQLKENPKAIMPLLIKGLEELPEGQEVKIAVSDHDLKLCHQQLKELEKKLKPGTQLELVVDSSLAQGSCRMESEEGEAEILLKDNFAELSRALLSLSQRRAKALEKGV